MKLYCLRHGTTAWTDAARYTGASDPELTDVGREEAAAAARTLARLGRGSFELAVTSPLRRCRETCDIVSRELDLRLQPREDARLQEIHYGDWEGRTRDEVLRDDPRAFDAWDRDPTLQAPPGGESVADVVARSEAALNDLLGTGATHVLLVSHRTVLRILVARTLGMPLGAYRRRLDHGPAALTVIDMFAVGDGKLLAYNLPPQLRG